MAVEAVVREITPAEAEELLGKNTHNRRITERRVDTFARDMKAGKWMVNGEAIKVREDGRLDDGQHRLLAVVKAGVPITTMLVTGIPVGAQETMDQGRARTLGDILHLRGEQSASQLAAALRALMRYTREGRVGETGTNDAPSTQELLALLEEHPEVRRSVKFVTAFVGRMPGRLTTGVSCALHYLMSSADHADADAFYHLINHGEGLVRGNPVWFLRERLIRDGIGTANRMRPTVKYALTVKAFNFWREGKTIELLSWRPGGSGAEAFPLIIGCPLNPSAAKIAASQRIGLEEAEALVAEAALDPVAAATAA
jgi:hypothetical protein